MIVSRLLLATVRGRAYPLLRTAVVGGNRRDLIADRGAANAGITKALPACFDVPGVALFKMQRLFHSNAKIVPTIGPCRFDRDTCDGMATDSRTQFHNARFVPVCQILHYNGEWASRIAIRQLQLGVAAGRFFTERGPEFQR